MKKPARPKPPAKTKPKPPVVAGETAIAFMNAVKRYAYHQGPTPRASLLTDFTFWAGAGFSKSWDIRSPTGAELFAMDAKLLADVLPMGTLSRLFGCEIDELTINNVRRIVYGLDMYERYPDLCPRYLDPQNIPIIKAALGTAVQKRFTSYLPLNHLATGEAMFPVGTMSTTQQAISGFFYYLGRQTDGSTGLAEGVRCHFVTTNYDYIIETILQSALAPDDSPLLYTYRGFTAASVSGEPNPTILHDNFLSQHLIKINGGFEILRDGDVYTLDYSERTFQEVANQPPIIMLPSREQDYDDPYFKTIFPKAVRLMRDSKVLVIVGYALTEDDALMRFILRQFSEEPEDARIKEIFYIDMNTQEEKLDRLREVFPSIRQLELPQVHTYEGGFGAFCEECLALTEAD